MTLLLNSTKNWREYLHTKLPTKLQLIDRDITVLTSSTLLSNESRIGEARYLDGTILIDITQDPEAVKQAYWHEKIHFCFDVIGLPELRDNEEIVDLLARVLHQAEKTEVYSDESL